MAHRDIVVIGTSAGGLEALQSLLGGLPPGFPAAVLVVMHRTENTASVLPEILARSSRLPVKQPQDGELVQQGWVYVAPAGVHMLVEHARLRLVAGPRENRHRPAIDPLFRSAAATFGSRVIGVILTGMLDDGTSGLMVVQAHGGVAIVQNPHTAMFPAMPENAVRRVPDARIAELDRIPVLLQEYVKENVEPSRGYESAPLDSAAKESRIADLNMKEIENEDRVGVPSEFACPECGGVLWQIEQGDLLRFRCRVGHAYTADHLQASQRMAVESALWAALRALEESLSMYKRMAERAHNARNDLTVQMYKDRIRSTETNARVLQEFLLNVNGHDTLEVADAEESA